jgi:pimeloyl-ACP methyl ester carboxylesterase
MSQFLVIRGAFAERDLLHGLPKFVPGPVRLEHLPGMHSPFLEEDSVEAFAEHFDRSLAGQSDVTVMGLSVGGLVALAMRHPSIKRLILVDTLLQTGPCWPLTWLRQRVESERQWRWCESLLGLYPDRLVQRDYRPLLRGLQVPTTALIASDPLGLPRQAPRMPGLITEEDKRLYRDHPLVSVVNVDSGHNVPAQATLRFIEAVSGAYITSQSFAP